VCGVCVCVFVFSFRLKVSGRVKPALFDCEWDIDDDSRLLRGVYEYGLGNWEAVKMDFGLQLHNKVGTVVVVLSPSVFHSFMPTAEFRAAKLWNHSCSDCSFGIASLRT